MHNGEAVKIFYAEDGRSACPVCGFLCAGEPPWTVDGGSFDICPSCHTEYGVDDGMASTSPVGSFAKRWEDLRIEWLNRNGWTDIAFRQLTNVGLDLEEVKKRRPR